MKLRKFLCVLLTVVILLPSTALAASLKTPKLSYKTSGQTLSWSTISGARYTLYRADTTDELGDALYSGSKRSFAATEPGVYRVVAKKGSKSSLISDYIILNAEMNSVMMIEETTAAPTATPTPAPVATPTPTPVSTPSTTPPVVVDPAQTPVVIPLSELTGVKADMRADGTWVLTLPAVQGATAYRVYAANSPSATPSLKHTFTNAGTYSLEANSTSAMYYTVECDTPAGIQRSKPVSRYDGLPSNLALTNAAAGASPYRVLINKAAQIVTVYSKDENGAYTVPMRHMICSTGRPVSRTVNGFYVIGDRHEWVDYNRTWAHYGVDLLGTEMKFHSVLYQRPDLSTLLTDTVDDLGTPQSLGCIRLGVTDIAWVYNNLPAGTEIEIVSGKDKLSALANYLNARKYQ